MLPKCLTPLSLIYHSVNNIRQADYRRSVSLTSKTFYGLNLAHILPRIFVWDPSILQPQEAKTIQKEAHKHKHDIKNAPLKQLPVGEAVWCFWINLRQ